MWEPKINDWHKVGHDSYKFMFEQSKDRFEEIISESEIITERSIKLLTTLVGFLTALISISIKKPIEGWWIYLIAFLYLIDVVLILLLMRNRSVLRGSPPTEMFVSNLDREDYSEDDKLSLLYYNEICRYQQRIEMNILSNKKRQNIYLVALTISLLLFVSTAVIVITTFYRP